MAQLEPKDKVEWRAGETPSSSHLRTGVVKELLPGGICLVRTKVEGQSVIEEIRAARLRKVEPPARTPKKRGRKARAGKAPAKRTGKGKKAGAKKAGKSRKKAA